MTMRSQRDANSTHWKKIRQRILNRDGRVCFWCGLEADTIDHIVPVAKGGTDHDENLVSACRRCNYSKKDSMPVDFLASRSTAMSLRGLVSPQNESRSHD
jgi:5-methylcytosine-specific restriction endonuclease McrA